MINRESKFATLFRHWLRANPRISGSYELKDSRGKNYIDFKEIDESQLDYGMAIKGPKGVLIRVQGQGGEPDYIYLREAPAYLVINYPGAFYIIDIETFITEKERSKRRSLTKERAEAIAIISVKTK